MRCGDTEIRDIKTGRLELTQRYYNMIYRTVNSECDYFALYIAQCINEIGYCLLRCCFSLMNVKSLRNVQLLITYIEYLINKKKKQYIMTVYLKVIMTLARLPNL